MSQLPPKIPTCSDIASPFVPNTQMVVVTSPGAAPPSWVLDEFLDFSSSRRGLHRRSASDSVAFLETPSLIVDDCRLSHAVSSSSAHHEFEKFDDEQFLSMFNDDGDCSNVNAISGAANVVPDPSCSNPSSPSDHNSINDDREVTAMEVQSHHAQPSPTTGDKPIDPRRVKRILANRQSAQRSRVRKLQYISELEHSVTSLQAEVSVLSPRVAFLDHQRLILNVDNSALKQRIAALAQDKIFKDAHQEALRREIERLTQVYHQQSMKKMESSSPLAGSAADAAPVPDPEAAAEKEQQLLQV